MAITKNKLALPDGTEVPVDNIYSAQVTKSSKGKYFIFLHRKGASVVSYRCADRADCLNVFAYVLKALGSAWEEKV